MIVNDLVASKFGLPIHVPAAPNDGGLSLGAAMHAQASFAHRAGKRASPYIGMPLWDSTEIKMVLGQCNDVEKATPEKLADVLTQNKRIVALVRGRQEFGPRALGHRSLLIDPRHQELKDRLNVLKSRQWYRPVAPMVLQADVANLFVDGSGKGWLDGMLVSPYMSRAPALTKEAADMFPAIAHVDGTARVQTVSADDEPWTFALLSRIKQLLGFGILGNTSLNRKGKPILNWGNDALAMLHSQAELDALVLEDFFLQKSSCRHVLDSMHFQALPSDDINDEEGEDEAHVINAHAAICNFTQAEFHSDFRAQILVATPVRLVLHFSLHTRAPESLIRNCGISSALCGQQESDFTFLQLYRLPGPAEKQSLSANLTLHDFTVGLGKAIMEAINTGGDLPEFGLTCDDETSSPLLPSLQSQ